MHGGTSASAPHTSHTAVGPSGTTAPTSVVNPATTATAPPAASSSPSTKDTAQAGPPAKSATVQALKFPNTTETVMFIGYASKNHMALFEKQVQDPASSHAYLIPDPADPGHHELPIAPGAKVIPLDPNGFPFETCPPVHCTSDDIMQSVIWHATLWAQIHVNAADRIDVVRQVSY